MGLFANPNPFRSFAAQGRTALHLEAQSTRPRLLEIQHSHGLTKNILADVPKALPVRRLPRFPDRVRDITKHHKSPADYELITYRLMEQLKAGSAHAEVYVSVGAACIASRISRRSLKDWNGDASASGTSAHRYFGSSTQSDILDLPRLKKWRSWQCAIGIARSRASGIGRDGRAGVVSRVYSFARIGLHSPRMPAKLPGPFGELNLRAERIGLG
jgi:hypothetical protein